MKKKRGQRRYYQQLTTVSESDRRKASDFLGDSTSWFDFGHTHFDWQGIGNTSWKKRLAHLDCLFKYFSLFEEKLMATGQAYQLFAILYDHDSSEDALYVHTQNPNTNNFPFQPAVSVVSNLKNSDLSSYLSSKTGFETLFGESESECYCIIYKQDTGIGLK